MLAVLQEDYEIVHEDAATPLADIEARVEDEKQKWKERLDSKHSTPKQYKERKLILIENAAPATGQYRKLEPKYRGRYIVKKVLDRDRYLVGDIEGAQGTQRPFLSVFTSDKIKRWCSHGPEQDDHNITEDNETDDNEEEEPNPEHRPWSEDVSTQEEVNCQKGWAVRRGNSAFADRSLKFLLSSIPSIVYKENRFNYAEKL